MLASINEEIGGAVASTIATGVSIATGILSADPVLAPFELAAIAFGSNFLGDIIGDLFGDGYRGRAMADGTMDLENGIYVAGPVYLDNNGNPAIANQLVTSTTNILNSLLQSFGGTVTSLKPWNVGQYESRYFSDDGTWPPPGSGQFSDPNDAVNNAYLQY